MSSRSRSSGVSEAVESVTSAMVGSVDTSRFYQTVTPLTGIGWSKRYSLSMSESTEAITLTEAAAEKIAELIGDSPEDQDQALRVAVRGGGCSGFQYALAFDTRNEDDHVFEHRGVAVIVDKTSMQFVYGSEVDYVEGLTGAGFQVQNPNVVAACGCGSSFQVKDDEEAAAAATA